MGTSAPCGWATNLWWCCMASKQWKMVSPPTQRTFLGGYRPTCSTDFLLEKVRCIYLLKDFVCWQALRSLFAHSICSWETKQSNSAAFLSCLLSPTIICAFQNLTKAAVLVLANLIYPLLVSKFVPCFEIIHLVPFNPSSGAWGAEAEVILEALSCLFTQWLLWRKHALSYWTRSGLGDVPRHWRFGCISETVGAMCHV